MSWRQTGIVYRKELLDVLRDRRTLISMVVVPMITMPLMIFGMTELTLRLVKKTQKETASIMILGGEHAPQTVQRLGRNARLIVVPPAEDYVARIEGKKLRAAVEFPPGFEAQLAAEDSKLTVKIYYYEEELRSEFARRTIDAALREFKDELVEARLASRSVSTALLEPFESQAENVASATAVTGESIGGVIPYMILLFALTGAIYPAVDLTAGEKERGTIETILASPVSRGALSTGKFLTVFTVSFSTVLLALVSLMLSSRFFFTSERAALATQLGFASLLQTKGALAMLLMVAPVTLMFSGLVLAVALKAKSFKEAQSYTQPLIMAAIIPSIASFLPIEMSAKLALIPILNVSLVSKDLLAGRYQWDWLAIIFASSCVYAVIAIVLAATSFRRESVLFRT